MNLADVAYELYGLSPAEFTAARNERTKELKADEPELAAQVKALAKPTTAAWLVNQLVRHHGDEVDQVAQVGAALREAQEDLDSGELMALNKQRHGVLRAVTQQARALAKELGHPVSTAITDEVEQTLRAVMSDADAAEAVRTGTLLRSLSGTGFGAVDLTDAVALPGAAGLPAASAGRRPAPRQGTGWRGDSGRAGAKAPASGTVATDELAERRREREREQRARERQEKALAEARARAQEADAAAAGADEQLDAAQASVDDLAGREKDLTERLRDLEQQVRQAQNELSAVQRQARTAARDRDRARQESEVAHRTADRARHQVERLT